jgi:hypothetical protein
MTEVTNAVDQVVEQMGLFFEGLGVPRAAGQMLGYLMVCDPVEQSAADIAQGIGVSAASVSSGARLLTQLEAVERRHRVGDRKTYYRLLPDFWILTARSKLQVYAQLAAKGRRIKSDGGLPRTDGIEEMIKFSEFWTQELPGFEERWRRYRETHREDA